MSGSKTFALSASTGAIAAPLLIGAGGVVLGIAALYGIAKGTEAVARIGVEQAKAFQDRVERAKREALEREQQIQKRIASIRIQSRQLMPSNVPQVGSSEGQNSAQSKNVSNLEQLAQFKNWLNPAEADFNALATEGLLDQAQVAAAFNGARQAIDKQDLAGAESLLQQLEATRIQVMQAKQKMNTENLNFASQRLDEIRELLPEKVVQQLEEKFSLLNQQGYFASTADIEELHKGISFAVGLAQEAENTAIAMVESWEQVGYNARLLPEVDQGDRLIEVQVHEEAVSLLRVRYAGTQIDLDAPKEADEACSSRLGEVVEAFRSQGYGLELTHIDGQPVEDIFSQPQVLEQPLSQTQVRRGQNA